MRYMTQQSLVNSAFVDEPLKGEEFAWDCGLTAVLFA